MYNNYARIVGNLGKDSVIRYTKNGLAVTDCDIATHMGNGDQQKTEWHRIVLFGDIAVKASPLLKKGGYLQVEGRLQTRKWTDKEGIDRYTTEIVAESLTNMFASSGKKAAKPETPPDESPEAEPEDPGTPEEGTDIQLNRQTM
jgi:single-strand DNA-binding protein